MDGVTLLIPHFQTPEAIRLCLRSIRRYTSPVPRVLVLDNGSRDASREYLASLRWIECIDTGVGNDLVSAQAAALNLGAARVETPLFAVLHSDTYVHRAGWLAMLGRVLGRGHAAVGSRHQTIRAYDAAWTAWLAERAAPWLARWRSRTTAAGVPWLRSCLTLYRTAAFRAAGCVFASDGREDATHAANAALAARGESLLPLPDRVVGYYVFHKGDTTRIANRFFTDDDAEFSARIVRHHRHVDAFRDRPTTKAILADASLDQ
jgi:hypothetical protein